MELGYVFKKFRISVKGQYIVYIYSTYICQKTLQLYPIKLAYFQTNSSSLANTAKYGILHNIELIV